MSDELDDLRDLGGRFRRMFVATFAGVVLAVLAFIATDEICRGHRRGEGWFAMFSMALAFLGGYALASAILRSLAARRWRAQRIPRARRVR